jgi:hypothetical protein
MTDIETAIMIKNMAREMVRRRTATAKNEKMSDKAQAFINEIKRDQKTDALTAKMSLDTIMRYAREQAAGREIKADDVMYGFMKEKTRVEKSTAKNAGLSVKRDFTWPRSFASGPASVREVKIKAGAPVEKRNGDYFVAPSYFNGDSLLKHDATYYGCRVAKDNIDGLGVTNAKNADEPKFDGKGFLLDKNGKLFFVYNGTTADLIIRKYKMMGINLTAVKDRTGDVYFKKA